MSSSVLPLSVLIPTLNEEKNIATCIASLGAVDEIVLVDSGSTDGTREIAASLGASVVDFNWNRQLPKKKNWALENVPWKHDWVFIIDADERFTPELRDELARILRSPPSSIRGYYVNRRFWFLGGWLKHCGYYPSWNLRFFQHRLGRYERLAEVVQTNSGDNEVHEHVEIAGQTERLSGELEHYAFPDIATWVEKHNRYSEWEATVDNSSDSGFSSKIDPALARKRRIKTLARRLPFRPTLRFLYHYFWRWGILDGYRGFVFCRLMAIYEFLSVAKGVEQRIANHRDTTS